MASHFLTLLAAAIISGSFLLILIFTPLAKFFGLIDSPDLRKRHQNNIPMVGGLAIYTIIVIAFTILNLPSNLLWMICTGSILVALGAIDDSRGLSVRLRLTIQMATTAIMIAGTGLWIRFIGIDLPFNEGLSAILGQVLTLLAVVALTNSFNMTDGIDGLAAGYMLVGLSVMTWSMLAEHGFIIQSEWLVILGSSVFTFWLVNLSLTPLKKVFLGDAGSLLLGYVMAWSLIFYSQKPVSLVNPVAALWCVALPLYDTCSVIVRRIVSRQSPFIADRRHLHYLLIDFGFSARSTLAILMAFSAIVSLSGVLLTLNISSSIGLSVFLFIFIFGVVAESIVLRVGGARG